MVTVNSRNLLDLINDIIDISKIEAGQLRITETACNINNTLYQIYKWIENEKYLKGKENIEIKLTVPDNFEKLVILTDEGRIKQIIVNFLTNSLKFTSNGVIEIGYKAVKNELVFFVKDTGIGISPENKAKIFERFQQADETISRKFGGTGLGLAISRAIVLLLNGKIWVESEFGKGSSFYFSIPLKQLSISKNVENINDNELKIDIDLKTKKILIAEDDEASYFYLKTIIEKKGGTVIHVIDGTAAIEYIKKNSNIDIILMDLHLPLVSGCVATQEIKKIIPNIPIIAQTADAQSETKAHANQCGFNDFITKPLSKEILYNVLKKYL